MYVSLLRGINVGGHNKIKMRELEEACRELGLDHVMSYIQSGNLVFIAPDGDSADELERRIEKQIAARFGLNVPVMVLDAERFKRAVNDSPFAGGEPEKSVLVFLDGEGAGEWAQSAARLTVEGERCAVEGNVAYVLCPHGLGRNKVANALTANPPAGAKATMRYWRTVNKIVEMVTKAEKMADMPVETGE